MKILILNFLIIQIFSIAHANNLERNHIVVTGHPDYPPIIWFSEKEDRLKGVAVEASQTFLNELNYKVKFRPISTWARALKEVKEGNIDIILPPYKTKSRKKEYIFPKQPFSMDQTVLFIRKGFEFNYNKLSDLKNYKGAAIINDSFGDEFDKYDKDILKIARLTKTEQCFRFLLRERADYIIAGRNAGMAVLAQMGFNDKVHIYERPVIETGMYLGVSIKSDKDIIKIVNHFEKRTDQWKIEGKFKELEKKYFKIYLNEMKNK